MRFAITSLALILAGLAATVHADDARPAFADKVDVAIRKEIESQKLVGVAVGVLQDGKINYLRAYGEADREKHSPATLETKFNWASNSKPLAAVLAMQLVEKKKLDLDADVRSYVPEFPEKKYKFTTRQLLCHQSGIPHYLNGEVIPTKRIYADADPFMNPIHSLDKFNRSSLIYEPGTKTDYSSYAYVLLSAVIQKAGGAPFADQVRDRITKLLKMESFEWDTDQAKPSWSTGYSKRGERIEKSPDEANYWKHGAGGFKSDVRDFARWAQALMGRELMTEATERAMWTMQPLKDGTPTKWGLGVILQDGSVSHNGSQPETKTRMVLWPKEKRGIVVMSNCTYADVGQLASAVEAALK